MANVKEQESEGGRQSSPSPMTSGSDASDRWEGCPVVQVCLVSRLLPNIHISFENSRTNRAKDMAEEVKFKYPQPFTWAQVMGLDIATISQGTQLTTPRKTERKAGAG